MAEQTISDEEFERQYVEAMERGKRESLSCERKSSPFDLRLYDEHGTVLEVEAGKDRWFINICQQESRSSRFITGDIANIRKIRDALTKILEAAGSDV